MKNYVVALAIILSFALVGCDYDASDLASNSTEFVGTAVSELSDEIKGLFGGDTGSSTISDETGADEDAGDNEEADTAESGDESGQAETKQDDEKGTDDKKADADDQGSGGQDAADAPADISSVSKSDLKTKVKVSDSFGCEKIYGFMKSDSNMLLSKSPDENDTESVIGYVKCIGSKYDEGSAFRIKSFKTYLENEYADSEDKINNVISLTSFKELSKDDLSSELHSIGVFMEGEDLEFVFPDSDSRIIDVSELSEMTKDQCDIARNEIYARHGRKFTTESLQEYFNSKSWYEPKYEPNSFPESLLNATEKKNAYTILEYEKKKGYI